MKIDISFEFGTFDSHLIAQFISKLGKIKILKLEIISERHLLKFNPLSEEGKVKEKREGYKSLDAAIERILQINTIDFQVNIESPDLEITINNCTFISIISEKDLDDTEYNKYIYFENFLSLVYYNPYDCLLESMGLHISELKANNGVHLFPGSYLCFKCKLIPNFQELITLFDLKSKDELLEVHFAKSINDITTQVERKGLSRLLNWDKYRKSSVYHQQVKFVNFVRNKKVIELLNIKIQEQGFVKVENHFDNNGLLNKVIFYLDNFGISTFKINAQYEYIEYYENGKPVQRSLKKLS